MSSASAPRPHLAGISPWPHLRHHPVRSPHLLCSRYRAAHEQLRRHGQFHSALGGAEADPSSWGEQIEELELVADRQLKRKSKKGTDVRWKYECEVLDDRLLDVVHLLAPAIMIECAAATAVSLPLFGHHTHLCALSTPGTAWARRTSR